MTRAILTISNITETETDSDFTVQATVTLSAEVEGGFDVAYSLALWVRPRRPTSRCRGVR